MAKLQRATQQVFASNANENSITQFGTAKNVSPNYTSNVEEIQGIGEGLSPETFLNGWANSLETDLAPFMQDSNALWFMITYQIAYLMQQGIPEYDEGTEYSVGSLCKEEKNGVVIIYKSLTDNNIGNATSDGTYWTMYSADDNLAKYEIGLPQPSLTNNLLANEVWLDGSEGTLDINNYSSIVNIANYPKLYAAWGTRFGGDGTTTFGLPNMTGRVLWGTNKIMPGYTFLDATLPNIKGSFGGAESGSKADLYNSGAFYTGATNKMQGGSSDNDADVTYFDANRYNTTYQDNATVRPPAIVVRWKTRYE